MFRNKDTDNNCTFVAPCRSGLAVKEHVVFFWVHNTIRWRRNKLSAELDPNLTGLYVPDHLFQAVEPFGSFILKSQQCIKRNLYFINFLVGFGLESHQLALRRGLVGHVDFFFWLKYQFFLLIPVQHLLQQHVSYAEKVIDHAPVVLGPRSEQRSDPRVLYVDQAERRLVAQVHEQRRREPRVQGREVRSAAEGREALRVDG